ncbi:uncharacterized protein LOC143211264 [Lasioglossum baleicum]|uniref:uncharacterized protein LOC143211264 n=1 Tax=Lasioglossum baleicum TaxID=434251 RepID=UPI003FCEAE8D
MQRCNDAFRILTDPQHFEFVDKIKYEHRGTDYRGHRPLFYDSTVEFPERDALNVQTPYIVNYVNVLQPDQPPFQFGDPRRVSYSSLHPKKFCGKRIPEPILEKKPLNFEVLFKNDSNRIDPSGETKILDPEPPRIETNVSETIMKTEKYLNTFFYDLKNDVHVEDVRSITRPKAKSSSPVGRRSNWETPVSYHRRTRSRSPMSNCVKSPTKPINQDKRRSFRPASPGKQNNENATINNSIPRSLTPPAVQTDANKNIGKLTRSVTFSMNSRDSLKPNKTVGNAFKEPVKCETVLSGSSNRKASPPMQKKIGKPLHAWQTRHQTVKTNISLDKKASEGQQKNPRTPNCTVANEVRSNIDPLKNKIESQRSSLAKDHHNVVIEKRKEATDFPNKNEAQYPPRRVELKLKEPPKKAEEKAKKPPKKAEEKPKEPPKKAEEKPKGPPKKAEEKAKEPLKKVEEKPKGPPKKAEEKAKEPLKKVEEKPKEPPKKAEEKAKEPRKKAEEKSKEPPKKVEEKPKESPKKAEEKSKEPPKKAEEKPKEPPKKVEEKPKDLSNTMKRRAKGPPKKKEQKADEEEGVVGSEPSESVIWTLSDSKPFVPLNYETLRQLRLVYNGRNRSSSSWITNKSEKLKRMRLYDRKRKRINGEEQKPKKLVSRGTRPSFSEENFPRQDLFLIKDIARSAKNLSVQTSFVPLAMDTKNLSLVPSNVANNVNQWSNKNPKIETILSTLMSFDSASPAIQAPAKSHSGLENHLSIKKFSYGLITQRLDSLKLNASMILDISHHVRSEFTILRAQETRKDIRSFDVDEHLPLRREFQVSRCLENLNSAHILLNDLEVESNVSDTAFFVKLRQTMAFLMSNRTLCRLSLYLYVYGLLSILFILLKIASCYDPFQDPRFLYHY